MVDKVSLFLNKIIYIWKEVVLVIFFVRIVKKCLKLGDVKNIGWYDFIFG